MEFGVRFLSLSSEGREKVNGKMAEPTTAPNRAPVYGFVILMAAFLMKDVFFAAEGDSDGSADVQTKEIPSLHLNRFAGPSLHFSYCSS